MASDGFLTRLRANLREAGIPATEADIDAIIAGGHLDRAYEVHAMLSELTGDLEPDYLTARAPTRLGRSDESSGTPLDAVYSPPVADGGEAETVTEMARLIAAGEISPVELTERSLQRLAEEDPDLNAFQLTLRDEARASAKAAETEIAAGDHRGPLHGVPVAVKDLLAMSGTVTAAGSKVLARRVTDFDAAAVERLRRAGAVIVGKTRLSEFAYWPGSTNPHYGPTRNPHDLARDTGGSSSGSAAAVAAGIVPAALGSDTGGSIRIPAALCGVVGLKPTFGRVSLFGCTPLAWSLDHLGPLTRTVEDSATVLAALAGPDPRDPRTRPSTTFEVPPDLEDGVADLRVGVLTADGWSAPLAEPDAMRAWRRSTRVLADAGATLVELELPEMSALWSACGLILAVEAATYHTATLQTHFAEYGEFCKGRLLGAFAYGAGDFVQAHRLRARVRTEWSRLWDGIDLLTTPSQPNVAPPVGIAASTRFTNPFNAMGWPAISVPFGSGSHGLPLGTQLVGRPWEESTVLRAARVLELGG